MLATVSPSWSPSSPPASGVGSTADVGRARRDRRRDGVLGGHHRLLGRRDAAAPTRSRTASSAFRPAPPAGGAGAGATSGSAIAPGTTTWRADAAAGASGAAGAAPGRPPRRLAELTRVRRHDALDDGEFGTGIGAARRRRRTTMTDAPASITRSVQVETPAPEIAVSPTRTVIAAAGHDAGGLVVGMTHDEREGRRRGEAGGGEPVEHVRRRVVVAELRPQCHEVGRRRRRRQQHDGAADGGEPSVRRIRPVRRHARPLRCAASCPRRRATALHGDRASPRRRRRSRARTPRRSP